MERPDPVSQTDGITTGIDWQPIPAAPIPGYPRAEGRHTVAVPLVPAYRMCIAPDRAHGPPLAFGSCSDPARCPRSLPSDRGVERSADPLDRLRDPPTMPGNPATSQHEADVGLRLSITDVRRKSDLADYTGELTAPLQCGDDRWNARAGGPESATAGGRVPVRSFVMRVPCTRDIRSREGSHVRRLDHSRRAHRDLCSRHAHMEIVRCWFSPAHSRCGASCRPPPVVVQGLFIP